MNSSELDRQLNQYLTEGFPKNFINDCSSKLSSLMEQQGEKEEARTLFVHLSSVIRILSSQGGSETENIKENIPTTLINFSSDSILKEAERVLVSSELENNVDNRSIAIGYCCYVSALQNKKRGEDFLTLYADSWLQSI